MSFKLKPREPPLLEFTDPVEGTTSFLVELDQVVQTVTLAFEGEISI
jgi:hypothetical protein